MSNYIIQHITMTKKITDTFTENNEHVSAMT